MELFFLHQVRQHTQTSNYLAKLSEVILALAPAPTDPNSAGATVRREGRYHPAEKTARTQDNCTTNDRLTSGQASVTSQGGIVS